MIRLTDVPDDDVPARMLETIACLARQAQADLRAHATALGLQIVHLQALSYLARANRYSNTAVALGDFLGSSKGTLSQTLQLLNAKGLVRREVDAVDRRVVRLSLTARGRKVVEGLSFARQWDAAVDTLPPGLSRSADRALTGTLMALQRATGSLSFGTCRGCGHFRVEGKAAFRCGLTGEALSERDATLICREHIVTVTA